MEQRQHFRKAAVLIPVYWDEQRQTLMGIYIQRAREILQSGEEAIHSGQIAFPGGKIEPGEQPLQTALREAREEIALEPETVDILGHLGTFSTLTSHFMTEAFVGWLHRAPLLHRNHNEVAAIFHIPFTDLLAQHRRDLDLQRWQDMISLHYHWTSPEHHRTICIWGMTGRMTWVFLDRVFFAQTSA
ncbi:MAG: CoA pyrophosphatase [candidate division KSB1 bacterium]|nr:CoA pyrophosphatase [candidate division KSB1 bacterium]MDQ7066094.1 CoA pyrophosphatase [candidate division KSB1 bacterium]